MKTFAIGDPHGCYRGLMQCFAQSGFDYQKDRLIIMGDTVDSWPGIRKCINEFLKIKDVINILGNHDEWFQLWYRTAKAESMWLSQGGRQTFIEYGLPTLVPKEHKAFFDNALLYYVQDNKLFVHGGVDVNQKDITKQDRDTLLWDRALIQTAMDKERKGTKWKALDYEKIFVGHTTTQFFKKAGEPIVKPVFACNVIDLDTGGGWSGKLTIMDIDTYEYWQSDYVSDLYPEHGGRQ